MLFKAIRPPNGSSFRLLTSRDLFTRRSGAHDSRCQYFRRCRDVDAWDESPAVGNDVRECKKVLPPSRNRAGMVGVTRQAVVGRRPVAAIPGLFSHPFTVHAQSGVKMMVRIRSRVGKCLRMKKAVHVGA